jgi:hypothetical protein
MRAALMVLALLVFAPPARALPETAEGEAALTRVQGPAESLVASAVYPGLGQLLNGSEHKAAIIGGVEAFLIARLVLEDRWTRGRRSCGGSYWRRSTESPTRTWTPTSWDSTT